MNHTALPLTAIAATLALAACAEPVGERDNTDPIAEATPVGVEAEPAIVELSAGDFGGLDLGAKIEGPQGPEPSGAFAGEAGQITSYVACPGGMDPCDPKTAPEGTVFTFVHRVTPSSSASAFRTAKPAYGFNGTAGYDMAQVRTALDDGSLAIACEDGILSWTVSDGASWNGEEITVYWQGTMPPAGPAPTGYELLVEGQPAAGPGPAPEAQDTATCG